MNRIILMGSCIGMLLFAGGCLHSNVDDNWASAYNEQIAVQTANPDAPSNTEPLQGLDSATGERVAERYYEGQEQQQHRIAPDIIPVTGN